MEIVTALFLLLLFLIIEVIYLMPVMACFEDTIPHLLRNALFFAIRRPLKMLLAAVIHIVPAVITVIDTHLRPLYGFIWTVCGFGLIAMMMAELLIRDFEEFLPKTEDEQIPEHPSKNRREILKEMKKLDQ